MWYRNKNSLNGSTGLMFSVCCIVAFVIAVILLIAGGCGNKEKADTSTVRVGYLRRDIRSLPFYVAVQKGFFEDEGLTVKEAGTYSSGADEMAVFSGTSLDAGYVNADSALYFALADLASVKAVAGVSLNGAAIVMKSGLEGFDVKSFEGKTVAVPGRPSLEDYILRLAFKKAGINYAGVEVIQMTAVQIPQAISSGKVEAFSSFEVTPSIVAGAKTGRVLVESRKIWKNHPGSLLVFSDRFIRNNPDTVEKFVHAHLRAIEFIRENSLEVIDMAHLFTGFDKETCESALKNVDYSKAMDAARYLEYVEYLENEGVLEPGKQNIKVNRFLDRSFLRTDA